MKSPAYSQISHETYRKADAHGIPHDRVYGRIIDLEWDEERAVSEPVRVRDNDPWIIKARENGISAANYRIRRKRGMSEEEAATVKHKKLGKPKDEYLEYWLKVAASNGIKPSTFKNRIYSTTMRWSHEDAATRPPHSRTKKTEA